MAEISDAFMSHMSVSDLFPQLLGSVCFSLYLVAASCGWINSRSAFTKCRAGPPICVALARW